MIKSRLKIYDPNGAERGNLPFPTEWSSSSVFCDIGAMTINYGPSHPGHELLNTPCEIAFETSLDGITFTEAINGRFLRIDRAFTKAGPDKIKKFTMPSYGWLLNKARQMITTGLNADGKRPFNSANPGMIMKTLIDEAKTRSVLPGLAYDFNSSVDSNGVAWNKVVSVAYEPGLDLFTILNNLSLQGICDWCFQGRTLRIFNADTVLASVKDISLLPGVDIKEMPVQGSLAEMMHSVLVLGDAGKRLSRENPLAPLYWGKWEGFVGQGGVSDTATMTIFADSALEDGAREQVQYTAEMNEAKSRYNPFYDFNPGDYVRLPDEAGVLQSFRVRGINIGRDGQGQRKIDLVINDRFLEKSIRQARKTNGITGGAGIGGSGTAPTKEPGARRPKKAEGLVVDSTAVINQATGQAEAWATMTYPATDTDVDNVALEIASYRFRARRPTFNLLTENASFEGAYTGGQGGSATVAADTAWKTDGLQSLKIIPNGTLNASSLYPVGVGDALGGSMIKMGVLQGKTYVIAADVRVNAVQTGALDSSARRIVVGTRATGGSSNLLFASSAAAPNRVGVTRVTVKFTVPATGIEDVFFRLMNGSSKVAETVSWDNVQVLEFSTSPWGSWASWGSSTGLAHGYGPLEPGKDWQVQFAAVSETGVQGDWSDTVQFTSDVDIVPPPVPSTPVLASKLGTLTVTWNGKDSTGASMPVDTRRVRVYRKVTGDPTGAEIGFLNRTAITTLVMNDVTIGVSYELWFVGEDNAGNLSAESAHATLVVASIMDDPAAALDIQEGVSVASGGNLNTYSPSTPGSAVGTRVNDKWFQITAGVTVGVWVWDGDSWEPETLSNAVIANLDAGKITTGTLAAARIASGSITADKIGAGEITAVKLSATALDAKTITGSTIKSGFVMTGSRVDSGLTGVGFYMDPNGYQNVNSLDGKRMWTLQPNSATPNVTIGSGNSFTQFLTTGRMRSYGWNGTAATLMFDVYVFPDSAPGYIGEIRCNVPVYATEGLQTPFIQTGAAGTPLALYGGTGDLVVNNQLTSTVVYSQTTGTAANVNVSSAGLIRRSTSATKYKINIQDYKLPETALDLRPVTWYDRGAMERLADHLEEMQGRPGPEREALDDIRSYPGFLAEDVERILGPDFVEYGPQGEIEGILYDRMAVPLFPLVKALMTRVEELEKKCLAT